MLQVLCRSYLVNSEHIRAIAQIDGQLNNIFRMHYGCEGNPEEDKPAGYMAWALLAVDVSVRVANMFLAIKNPNEHRTYRALCDTTYELPTNEFWVKNASVILPLIHAALNAYRDSVDFAIKAKELGEYSSANNLMLASRAAPLEIFPVIAYLVGGPALMVAQSAALKSALAPYFLE